MRTTVRLDPQLMDELKLRAEREQTSVTRLLNRALRAGLDALDARKSVRRQHRERPASMGMPRVPLDKALALAATLEDEESVRELLARR